MTYTVLVQGKKLFSEEVVKSINSGPCSVQGFIQDFRFGRETMKYVVDAEGVL